MHLNASLAHHGICFRCSSNASQIKKNPLKQSNQKGEKQLPKLKIAHKCTFWCEKLSLKINNYHVAYAKLHTNAEAKKHYLKNNVKINLIFILTVKVYQAICLCIREIPKDKSSFSIGGADVPVWYRHLHNHTDTSR